MVHHFFICEFGIVIYCRALKLIFFIFYRYLRFTLSLHGITEAKLERMSHFVCEMLEIASLQLSRLHLLRSAKVYPCEDSLSMEHSNSSLFLTIMNFLQAFLFLYSIQEPYFQPLESYPTKIWQKPVKFFKQIILIFILLPINKSYTSKYETRNFKILYL